MQFSHGSPIEVEPIIRDFENTLRQWQILAALCPADASYSTQGAPKTCLSDNGSACKSGAGGERFLRPSPHQGAPGRHNCERLLPSTKLYRVDPQTRIAAIRKGIPASTVGELSSTMGINMELLLGSLGLSRATISRKEKDKTALSKDESERLWGFASLIGKVQMMVEESGEPSGFDAAHWLADWLAQPLPALGGATPASYMDTGAKACGGIAVHEPERGLRVTTPLWRIAVEAPRYTANDLGGAGAKMTGGRWNSVGTPLIYSATNISLATLETALHLRSGGLPFNRLLVRIAVPNNVWAARVVLGPLPGGWDAVPSGMTRRATGDCWVASGSSALLLVPSVIVPDEYNVLINPLHPDVTSISATTVRRRIYDARFLICCLAVTTARLRRWSSVRRVRSCS